MLPQMAFYVIAVSLMGLGRGGSSRCVRVRAEVELG
jgi:hypothetical protein